MIKAAAEAGADAAKFQAYTCDHIGGHADEQHLEEIMLDESIIRYLYWRCQQHGIEFMCTPFYPEAVVMLDPYVKRWKVRCADRFNELLLKAIDKTDKEVLISVKEQPSNPKTQCNPNYRLLYCDPQYPPGLKQEEPINLGQFDGYSCHVPVVDGIVSSVVGGNLKYLEVHVRLDHYEPPHYCPIDTAVSITMSELAELCRRLKP